MVHHHRDEHSILKYFASAAAGAVLALLAACGPVIPQHYLREMEAARQSAAQRIGQENEVQRLTRFGRYDEAQRIAREIEEQEQAKAQRCAETWRQAEEIDRLQKEGRYGEMAQILRNRAWSNVECNTRPRRSEPERREKMIEGSRNKVQFDAVGTRQPLYVVPQELFSPESSILDSARFGGLPEAAWSLLLQAQSTQAAGNMRETESMLARALALVQQTPGPNDRAVSYVMMRQAWAAEQQNRLPEALRYIESAIALVEQSRGQNAKMLSPLLWRHAELLIRNGDLQQGLAAGERAYALHADAAPSSPQHAIALNNRGMVFHLLGDTQRALDAYQKSLDTMRRIRETAPREERGMIDYAHMPSMLSNMGLAQWQSGNFSQAAQYFAQAQEALLEQDNVDRAETESGGIAPRKPACCRTRRLD